MSVDTRNLEVVPTWILQRIYNMAGEVQAEEEEQARIYKRLSKRHKHQAAAHEANQLALWADTILQRRNAERAQERQEETDGE